VNFTVRDILNLEVLKGIEVAAGQQGLDKQVNHVTVFDAPDAAEWVKGHEFVITTLYVFQESCDQIKLICDLAEKNVSALGIKLKRYVNGLCQDVIDMANKRGLPLLIIPYDKAWVDVINPIMAEILNQQLVLLEKANAFRRSFTQQVLEGKKISSIAKLLSELTHNPITIIELINKGSVTWPYFFRHHINQGQLWDLIRASHQAPFDKIISNINHVEGIIFPIEVAKNIEGYIIVWKTKELSGLDLIAIEHASTVTALYIQKLKAINETDQRFKDAFIRELIQGESCYSYVQQKGEKFGWNISQTNTVIVVKIIRDQKSSTDAWETNYLILNKIKNNITLYFAKETLAGIDSDDTLIFLVSNKLDSVMMHMENIQEDIQAKNKSITLAIGIGDTHQGIEKIAASFREANIACQLSKLLKKICKYGELGPYLLFIPLIESQETEEFLKRYILPVVSYDKTNGTELLKTLDSFVNLMCNYRETAKALYVHHNTIRYRLNTIEKLIGYKLRHSEEIINIMLGLKLYKLRN